MTRAERNKGIFENFKNNVLDVSKPIPEEELKRMWDEMCKEMFKPRDVLVYDVFESLKRNRMVYRIEKR